MKNKAKIRLLNFLVQKGVINGEDFYSIRIDTDKIVLQGLFDRGSVVKYQRIFSSTFNVTEHGWLELKSKNFTITLT